MNYFNIYAIEVKLNNEVEPKGIIAIIGGTGKEGKGLAYRWSMAGYQVIIGSRSEDKAQIAVNEVKEYLNNNEEFYSKLSGKTNKEAVVKLFYCSFDSSI